MVSMPGDGRERVQVDAAADLRAESPCVVGDPGRTGEVGGAGRVGEVLGRPEPDVDAAAAGIGAGFEAAEQDARTDDGDTHPARPG